MNQEKALEEAKRLIAQALFEGSFGDDAARNWYMACLLIARDDFKSLCEWAKEAQSVTGDSTFIKETVRSFLKACALCIYQTSFGLAMPSTNSDVNWFAAEHLYCVLSRVLRLVFESPTSTEPATARG